MPLSAALFLSLNAVCISGFEEQNEGGGVELEEKVNEELDEWMDEIEMQDDRDDEPSDCSMIYSMMLYDAA